MPLLVRMSRALWKLRFHLLRLATIKDIPTDAFETAVRQLQEAGWRKVREYDGFDAWIDYGRVVLRRGRSTLKCEWDNYTEGSIEGPRRIVEELGRELGFAVTHDWRWSEWDAR